MSTELENVAREIVRRAGRASLSAPVSRVLAAIGQAPGADALRGMAKVSRAATIGEVLLSPDARRRFTSEIERHEQTEVSNALLAWARDLQVATGAGEDVRVNAARHAEEHELEQWTRRLGVEDRLSDPVESIAPFLPGGDKWAGDELRYFATGDVRKAALGRTTARTSNAFDVRDAARRYLEHCAAEIARDERRNRLWDQAPKNAAFARIAPDLKKHEARLARTSGRPAPLQSSAVELDVSTPRLIVRDSAGARAIALGFARHEQGLVDIDPPQVRPALALALVRYALDVVHDPMHALHAQLADALETPAWTRLVAAVDAEVSGPARAQEEVRLVFRVSDGDDGHPALDCASQRIGKTGRWSKGTRVEPRDAISTFATDPSEILALRVLDERNRGGTGTSIALALYALIGHPRVVYLSGNTTEPIEVRLVEARFALTDDEEGIRAGLALGPVTVSPDLVARRISGSGVIAHIASERGLVVVARVEAALAQLMARAAQFPAAIPREQTKTLLPLIERVAARVPVTLPPALEADIAPTVPIFYVRLTPDDEGARAEIRVRLGGVLSAPAGEGAPLVSLLEPGTATPVLRRRNLDSERHAAHELAREIAMPEGDVRTVLASEDAIIALLEALSTRPEIEVEWPDAAAKLRHVGTISSVSVRVKSAAEWFGVEGDAEIDGDRVKLAELLAAVRAGKRYVKVGKGRFAAIEDDLRARLEKAADVVFETGKGALAVVPAAGDALEALADASTLKVDAAWQKIRAKLASAALDEPEIPADLTATLRSYQHAGFTWLARLASIEAGAILADDMGLGKTVQALALLVHRAAEGPALVVTPTSVGDNWVREASRFAPTLRFRLHRGPARHAALDATPLEAGDVLVASYDIVALDVQKLSSIDLATLVLDEAQSIKNPEAQRTKAVRALRARARFALTGTPLENRLADLWSIVSIVHPGLLGPWEHFRQRFALPIERDGNRARLTVLATLVRPYVLRRTKEVVTPELPPRIEIVRSIELSDAERKLYEAERTSAIVALGRADESQRFQVLAALTRLRQLACDTELVVPGAGVPSSKLAVLAEIVEELESAGRKVLVFSQFVRLLERAETMLRARGTSVLLLRGSTPAEERARRVARFQAGEATVFLLSLKAGGTGLNLTAADHVIHLDPWWNPAVEDQASDRAHRIGQDKPVTIIRLVANGTIEESVLALHESKRALSRGVLDGADAAGKMSASDLVALIKEGSRESSRELLDSRRRPPVRPRNKP